MSSEGGEAAFNGAVATLIRMDLLLQKISQYALNQDYEQWLITLKHLKREISPYIKDKEFDDITLKLNELKELEWIIIDEQGRKKVVEEGKVEEILDYVTVKTQKAMFDANILMARREEGEGYD